MLSDLIKFLKPFRAKVKPAWRNSESNDEDLILISGREFRKFDKSPRSWRNRDSINSVINLLMVHNVSSSANKPLILRQLYTFFASSPERIESKYPRGSGTIKFMKLVRNSHSNAYFFFFFFFLVCETAGNFLQFLFILSREYFLRSFSNIRVVDSFLFFLP